MKAFRAWLVRLAESLRRSRRERGERELAAELESHVAMHVEENLRRGMSVEEARRDALIKLGGIEQTKESYRERRGLPMIEVLIQDVRYALRMLRKNPGFTCVAVLTLALGIGANTAIFSVVNAVLLRPLAFPEANRLKMVWATDRNQGRVRDNDVASFPDFEDWKAQSKSFEAMAAFTTRGATLSSGDLAERVAANQVSPGFFDTLGVQPAMGRGFQASEQEAGTSHVLLLSDVFWKRRFAGRADVLGQTVRVNEEPYTVIGVMPPGFEFPPGRPEQIYMLLVRDMNRNHGFLRVIGRLRRGVSGRAAQAEIDIITRRLEEAYPKSNKGLGTNVEPLVDALVGKARYGLWIFLGVVGLVLLIACTNVANLTLARSVSRQRELAVRAALGAGRARLTQQLLTESAVLALGGGALGLLIANGVLHALVRLLSKNFPIPRLDATHVDGWVLGFTFLLSLATGILFGVIPAAGAAGTDVTENLRETTRAATGSVRGRRVRAALVITETALALVLLAGAGLLLKSLLTMRSNAPGFQSENLLAVDLFLPRSKMVDAVIASPARMQFFGSMLDRVRSVPGVRSAALVADLPLGGGQDSFGFHISGRPDPPSGAFSAQFNIASPDYFRTMGIPLRTGREFNEDDTASAPGVVLINDAAARAFWPGEVAVGKQILLPSSKSSTVTLTVAGVTGDVRQAGLGSEPKPEVFLNYMQPAPPWPWLVLVVKTTANPSAVKADIRSLVRSFDRDMPMIEMRTMDEVLSASLAEPSVYTMLLGVFALLALALAVVGLYGVVSYTVTQRTHEMGIRMALGAERGDVLRLVLRQGFGLALGGTVIGILCALAVTRTLVHLVPSVLPGDPLTLIAVSALLLVVALGASYVPARRATKVDPVVALRYE